MKKETFLQWLTVFFILLFVYAASSKLLDHKTFQLQLGRSPLLTNYAPLVAWLIPLLELAIVATFLFTRFRLLGFYCSFGIMVLFTAYIIAITQFSDYIPCSCGGILSKMTWNQHLWFNLGAVALSTLAIVLLERKVPVSPAR